MRSVDDEEIDPGGDERGGPLLGVGLDSHRGADAAAPGVLGGVGELNLLECL